MLKNCLVTVLALGLAEVSDLPSSYIPKILSISLRMLVLTQRQARNGSKRASLKEVGSWLLGLKHPNFFVDTDI